MIKMSKNKKIIIGILIAVLLIISVVVVYKVIEKSVTNRADFNFKVDNNSSIPVDTVNNKEKEITWEEITENGVNEELILEKLDTQILEKIAKNLQDVMDEEIKDEQENPQILITEGWIRIFNKEKYKEIISIGKPAMKPLYYILYKSENNGLYEFLCAKALQEISGIGGEIADDGTMQWSTAKEYLELFTKKVTNDE